MEHHELLTDTAHIISITTILGSIAGFIPTFAALVAVIWYCILIWESETMKKWRAGRALRKLSKLKAQEAALLSLIKSAQTPEDESESPVSDNITSAK